MPNQNLNPNSLRSTSYRSIPVLKIPQPTVNVRQAITGNFLSTLSDVRARVTQTNVPVISPQFQEVTPRNVGNNLRKFWNGTLRPIVVPARRHA